MDSIARACALSYLRFHPTDGEPRISLHYDGPPDWAEVRASAAGDRRIELAIDTIIQLGMDVFPVTSFGVGNVELLRVTRGDVKMHPDTPHILYSDVGVFQDHPPRRAAGPPNLSGGVRLPWTPAYIAYITFKALVFRPMLVAGGALLFGFMIVRRPWAW